MVVIEAKEFFLSYDPAYQYEVLAPGYTFPDLFTPVSYTHLERGRGREEKRKRGREEERKRGGRLDTGGPCFWRCKI